MTADDVVSVYQYLAEHGIRVWLQGGWGVDALLGRQTRPHKDLDLLLLVDDAPRATQLLSDRRFAFRYAWPESRWIDDANGVRYATAFVLGDDAGREIDIHLYRLNHDGSAVAAWDAGDGERVLTPEELAGVGSVGGRAVHCYSAPMQIRAHTGYDLPPHQCADLRLLRETFGVADAEGQAHGG